MPRRIAFAALAALVLALAGCASNDPATERPRESSIPWNKPASWEGPGVYGSAINQQ
ncbi:MAG: hypothetical protein PHC88_05935 [Terrimicrobiaceae bacterium]|nr:hypothetical protein [Terrimicrobiaceae bacterium]